MKKITFLFLCAAILIASCKKNSTGPTATDVSKYYVSSVRNYAPGYLGIDSFSYNSSNLLTRYVQYENDSTNGTPIVDSVFYIFSYSGSSPVPSSYTYLQPSVGTNEVHQLSYDAQNRVTGDVCATRIGFFVNLSYPAGNDAATVQFSSSVGDNQIDTLTITNGNATKQVVYYPNSAGTADSLEGTLKIGYSANGNPAYHAAISNSLGPLLFILSLDGFSNFVDFNSKDMANSITDIEPGVPNRTINYSFTSDSKGRVSKANYSGYPDTYRLVYSYY